MISLLSRSLRHLWQKKKLAFSKNLPSAPCQEESEEKVPSQPLLYPSMGVAEGMVIGFLERFEIGGLRIEYPNGDYHYFGKPGAIVTARMKLLQKEAFFHKIAFYGDIGLGEGYTEGIWETENLLALIRWFIINLNQFQKENTASSNMPGINLLRLFHWLTHFGRSNSLKKSPRNITDHYDLGNDFYKLWLDPSMTYSSAFFKEEGLCLEAAQQAKYEALCQKLRLQPNDQILEIGCGWGGFAIYAAQHYQVNITGITLSPSQAAYAREKIAALGLEDHIEIRVQDYRKVEGSFDKIVSIEMLEAVGDRYHRIFFATCHRLLKREGLLGLQAIVVPDRRYQSLKKSVDWIQRYIFPGSLLLSVGRINEMIFQTGDLSLYDLEDFGKDYAKTLSLWHERFIAAQEEVLSLGFDHQFLRRWSYYLRYCEAGFATRNISVVQMVYTRPNNLLLAD